MMQRAAAHYGTEYEVSTGTLLKYAVDDNSEHQYTLWWMTGQAISACSYLAQHAPVAGHHRGVRPAKQCPPRHQQEF
jgi:hypothetical protein